MITSGRKLIGYTTCFLKNPWILQLKSNGRNSIRLAGAIFVLNNLVTPKRVLKYAIIAITQAITEGPLIGIAV